MFGSRNTGTKKAREAKHQISTGGKRSNRVKMRIPEINQSPRSRIAEDLGRRLAGVGRSQLAFVEKKNRGSRPEKRRRGGLFGHVNT